MIYLIIGTQAKCLEWLNGINNDANYSNYWDLAETVITYDNNKGDITGEDYTNKGVILNDVPVGGNRMTVPQKQQLLFILEATGSGVKTVTEIYFGGIITSKPRQFKGKDFEGNHINQINLQASSFAFLADEKKVDLAPMINQFPDIVINLINNHFTNNALIKKGTVNRPAEKLSVIRFSKERRAWGACRAIASLYEDWKYIIDSSFTSDHIGGLYNFQELTKTYTAIVLSDDFIEELGPDNSDIGDNSTELANIVTLPFFIEESREPERFTQVTTTNVAELNSRVPLSGIPVNVERTLITQQRFQVWRIDETLQENDNNNSSPPNDHTESEGFLVSGDINGVTGYHFINYTGAINEWGRMALINNPAYILFEPQKMTVLRIKELSISSLGDAIVCAYYDNTTISSNITNVISASEFDVTDGTKFSADMLVKINDEERAINNVSTNRIVLKNALSQAPDIDDICFVGDYNYSRIIFGLELKTNGDIYIIENGVARDSGQNYTSDTYTIRNLCCVNETWLSVDTSNGSDILTLNNPAGFEINDIIEVHHLGNNEDPSETKVISKNGNNIQINTTGLGFIPINTRVRTKPKAKLQINGGAFGEVSGKTWTDLGNMTNTIQSEPDTIKEIGFCIAMQKSLIGTIKEFTAIMFPPVEVYINNNLMVTSTEIDNAESDIDCFLIARNERYFIELPSDTKEKWTSGTTIEVKYNEKRMHHLTKYNDASISEVATARGTPIEADDTEEDKIKKGGIEAESELLISHPITFAEARTLLKTVLAERSEVKLRVKLDNLISNKHGKIRPGMFITVNSLTGYDNDSEGLEINRIVATYFGQDRSNNSVWKYYLEANVPDNISLLLTKYSNTPKRIIDEATDDTSSLLKEH